MDLEQDTISQELDKQLSDWEERILNYQLKPDELWILPEDAKFLIDEYSRFVNPEDLRKFIHLIFVGLENKKIRERRQEFRDKFGIGTENEFDLYLRAKKSVIEIDPFYPRESCKYCGGERVERPIGTKGYPQNLAYYGLCRRHSKEWDFICYSLGIYNRK
jgi:hypothetical protein